MLILNNSPMQKKVITLHFRLHEKMMRIAMRTRTVLGLVEQNMKCLIMNGFYSRQKAKLICNSSYNRCITLQCYNEEI